MAVLTESYMLDFTALVIGLSTLLYFFFTRHFNHWKKLGISYVEPTPFVGNFKDIVLGKKNAGQVVNDIYFQSKPKPYVGMFAYDHPLLVVNDLELIKLILVKDFTFFSDRNFHPNEKEDPMFSKNLFGMRGPRWKQLRVKLTPTFTSGKMKIMFDLVNECGKELTKFTDRVASSDGILEIKDAMARYTTDVIATCAFGIQCNSLNDSEAEFRRVLRKIFEFSLFRSIKMTAVFFAPKLVSTFGWKVLDGEVDRFVRDVVWSTVRYREVNGVVRKDFLDLLMQIRKKGRLDDEEYDSKEEHSQYPLEGDDFVAQAFVFLVAGFETSSTTMSFALYELAMNRDIQQRLRENIMAVLTETDGEVTYDSLQKMTYLDMVVSETLRKYPVVPFLDRKVTHEYQLPGTNTVLTKNTSIIIPVWGVHMDPEYYPEPQRFDPERFSEENKKTRPSGTHLPFGDGPRNCIGSRMGYMQVKVGLIHLLSAFEVCPLKDTPDPVKLDPKSFLVAPDGGIPLGFKKLH